MRYLVALWCLRCSKAVVMRTRETPWRTVPLSVMPRWNEQRTVDVDCGNASEFALFFGNATDWMPCQAHIDLFLYATDRVVRTDFVARPATMETTLTYRWRIESDDTKVQTVAMLLALVASLVLVLTLRQESPSDDDDDDDALRRRPVSAPPKTE